MLSTSPKIIPVAGLVPIGLFQTIHAHTNIKRVFPVQYSSTITEHLGYICSLGIGRRVLKSQNPIMTNLCSLASGYYALHGIVLFQSASRIMPRESNKTSSSEAIILEELGSNIDPLSFEHCWYDIALW